MIFVYTLIKNFTNLTTFNFLISVYTKIIPIFAKNNKSMEEITKKSRGGKRERAGRPAGTSTTAMSLRLDNDLYQSLKSLGLNKNRFINDAIREKMIRDGILE